MSADSAILKNGRTASLTESGWKVNPLEGEEPLIFTSQAEVGAWGDTHNYDGTRFVTFAEGKAWRTGYGACFAHYKPQIELLKLQIEHLLSPAMLTPCLDAKYGLVTCRLCEYTWHSEAEQVDPGEHAESCLVKMAYDFKNDSLNQNTRRR